MKRNVVALVAFSSVSIVVSQAVFASGFCTINELRCSCNDAGAGITQPNVYVSIDPGTFDVEVDDKEAKSFDYSGTVNKAFDCVDDEYNACTPNLVERTQARQQALSLANALKSSGVCGYIIDNTTSTLAPLSN